MDRKQGKRGDRQQADGEREPRAHRNLSNVDDGGAPQSANASGDGAARTGNRTPKGAPGDKRQPEMSHLGYGKGSEWPADRKNVDAMRNEDMEDGAARSSSTPAGAAGSRRNGQQDSLKSGRPRTGATGASQPTTGTARRAGQPGGASLHGGMDGTSPRANPREDVTRPRSDDLGRRPRVIEGDKRPKRSLLSRLNPFSRH